ncbi:hypothetical protein Q3G72_021002 [Acer saccharum]|nr:hypothetical protein Q3G72_021002 [Acer saccharum]
MTVLDEVGLSPKRRFIGSYMIMATTMMLPISLFIRFELSKMECDGDVGEVEGEEANVCRGFTEQRAVDINGVFVTVSDSGE